jgi:Zn-dependent peptidase ImmA (M78 family)/transcriptional regulator with XRE-family HTH domain
MAINLETLGVKLARYRAQLKESVDDVSKGTGISVEHINSFEAGIAAPSGDEILILADHFHCDFKFFISNEQVAPFEQTETLYRSYGGDFSKSDRRAIQEFLYLCETEAFLMEQLGRRTLDFSHQPSGNHFKTQGEAGANALRNLFGYPDHAVPRDVYDKFRSVGVHVFRRRLEKSSISGLFINHPTAGRCTLVNYSEDVYRQRFSAAHEMAHAIFDVDQVASVSYVHTDGSDLRELRANRFASCFLMPSAFLKSIRPRNGWDDEDALHWANELRVSCAALGIALVEAQVVDAQRGSAIKKLRVPKDAKLDPELPDSLSPVQLRKKKHLMEMGLSDFYVGLCFDALHQDVISNGRLAEALLTNPSDLGAIASLYGRSLYGN